MSKFVTLHGFGGGGGVDLNFEIVGGTTQPSNPTENTIWVNTDVEITGYYFSSTQPENMQNGEVWISIGTSSQIAFNALKGNNVTVYPLNAKQVKSGILTDLEAKTYQSGEWISWWNGELYDAGNEYENITGGWVSAGTTSTSSSYKTGGTTTTSNGLLSIDEIRNGYSNSFRTVNKINLENVKTIYFKVDSLYSLNCTLTFCICTASNCIDTNAIVKTNSVSADNIATLDVSSYNDSYYVAFGTRTSGDTGTKYLRVSKIWME